VLFLLSAFFIIIYVNLSQRIFDQQETLW